MTNPDRRPPGKAQAADPTPGASLIAQGRAAAQRASSAAQRRCLRCSIDFKSAHAGNRLCARCRQANRTRSDVGGLDDC